MGNEKNSTKENFPMLEWLLVSLGNKQCDPNSFDFTKIPDEIFNCLKEQTEDGEYAEKAEDLLTGFATVLSIARKGNIQVGEISLKEVNGLVMCLKIGLSLEELKRNEFIQYKFQGDPLDSKTTVKIINLK